MKPRVRHAEGPEPHRRRHVVRALVGAGQVDTEEVDSCASEQNKLSGCEIGQDEPQGEGQTCFGLGGLVC